MDDLILPTSSAPRQSMHLALSPNGRALEAEAELRYLPAPDLLFLTIRDAGSGELLVNQIPLICSYGELNDLLLPFSYLRGGKGLGSLFVLRAVDAPSTPDPSRDNLSEFRVVWGDTYPAPV